MEASRGMGEVRRIHIIYFLSRNGKIEQPHLIRLHYVHRKGVRLRDVKRWLSELRGKEMTDSFSWSYKRRYKAGYVWQDLTDDDLITAISDNEYVLKGSLLPSLSCKAEEDFLTLEEEDEADGMLLKTPAHETLKIDDSISPKPPQCTDEDSPKTPAPPASSISSSEEAADRKAAVFKIDSWKEELKRSGIVKKNGSKDSRTSSKGSSDLSHGGRRRRTSDILRNLLRCKTVDTDETAVKRTEKKGARKTVKRAASAKYKAVFEPNCSQCGKSFRPEKLHLHMKNCRGLKENGNRKEGMARSRHASTMEGSKSARN